MAKNKEHKIQISESLPQNILLVGEKDTEEKSIYISQDVYKRIHAFTKNKTTNESGGILVGAVVNEFGKTNIVIQGFIEAKYTEATPTTLTFKHETWEYVHAEMDKTYSGGQIVGWIHTHPDFGIFLSEYDKFIQENFFKEEHQVAYVVDPIQKIEGFYCWINEKIERCKGFYIFDDVGKTIDIDVDKNKEKKSSAETEKTKPVNLMLLWIGIAALIVLVVVLGTVSINLSNRVSILEKQQENIVESANNSLSSMQQQISSLAFQIEILQGELDSLKPTEAETDNTYDSELEQGEDAVMENQESIEGEEYNNAADEALSDDAVEGDSTQESIEAEGTDGQ